LVREGHELSLAARDQRDAESPRRRHDHGDALSLFTRAHRGSRLFVSGCSDSVHCIMQVTTVLASRSTQGLRPRAGILYCVGVPRGRFRWTKRRRSSRRDESITALDLQTMLGQQGYEVVGVVATGKAAIEKVERRGPISCCFDIRLRGELDGVAVAEAIGKDVAVVFLTAHGDDETLGRANTTQPYGYLIKPFEDRQLQVTVEIALLRHHLERGSWRASAGSRRRSPASTTP